MLPFCFRSKKQHDTVSKQTGRWRLILFYLSVLSCVRPSVRSSVTKLVTYWTRMNRCWCKLAQVFTWQGQETIILGSRGQRSRSNEAEDRFGGLAEASFSTHLGWVASNFVRFCVLKSVSLWCVCVTPNLWNCPFHELGSLVAQFVKWTVSQI